MSIEPQENTSYEVVDIPPSTVEIFADALLDGSNGFHFREWTQPGQGCYRWSGIGERIRLPIRVDRSAGNLIAIDLMRTMCEPSGIRILVDGRDVAVTETRTTYGVLVSAVTPPAPGAGLLLEIVSATQPEGTFPGARILGLAVRHIRITPESA